MTEVLYDDDLMPITCVELVVPSIDEKEFSTLDDIVDSALVQLHDRVMNGDITRIPSLFGDGAYVDQRHPLSASTLTNIIKVTTDRRDEVRIRQKQKGSSVEHKRKQLIEALLATYNHEPVTIDGELVDVTDVEDE